MIASLVGLYSVPYFSRLRPAVRETTTTKVSVPHSCDCLQIGISAGHSSEPAVVVAEVASDVFSLCFTHVSRLLVRVGGSCYLINGLQKIS